MPILCPFFYLRLYITLYHWCAIQLKYRLLFMRSFSSLISKFQFHLLSNTSEGGKSKAICPLSTKYTLPFYGEGGYFWGKNKCKPHLIIIGHSLHNYYIQYFFEWMIRVMLGAISNLSWTNCGLWLPRGFVKNIKQMVLCPLS